MCFYVFTHTHIYIWWTYGISISFYRQHISLRNLRHLFYIYTYVPLHRPRKPYGLSLTVLGVAAPYLMEKRKYADNGKVKVAIWQHLFVICLIKFDEIYFIINANFSLNILFNQVIVTISYISAYLIDLAIFTILDFPILCNTHMDERTFTSEITHLILMSSRGDALLSEAEYIHHLSEQLPEYVHIYWLTCSVELR